MSLIYRLLGIPRTIEEFGDKVKRTGGSKVDIRIHLEDFGDMGPLCKYVATVNYGKHQMPFAESTCIPGLDEAIGKDHAYFKREIEIAKETLRNRDLEVKE